ncbi:hypothetical protein ACRPM7_22125, partial [Burkholderia vietnamiensis]|uniref:hypothetical protein n=1 Tax=Burkholderia vietnamiensis TaxID=60552 RepID=UPI0030B8FE05
MRHGLSGARCGRRRTRGRSHRAESNGLSAAARARATRGNGPYRHARFSMTMTDASALISTSYSRYLARAVAARPALAE